MTFSSIKIFQRKLRIVNHGTNEILLMPISTFSFWIYKYKHDHIHLR